ncbi:Uncharacterised protein [Mannheimia haemolytica]|uniref:Uncharacterized protein n=1 Tax=Mannheimia haemolytica TaxID=75985 RepID=A0A378MX66_MANHA|nr:Uncharacterised protein [Mannheimia haemolytica]
METVTQQDFTYFLIKLLKAEKIVFLASKNPSNKIKFYLNQRNLEFYFYVEISFRYEKTG